MVGSNLSIFYQRSKSSVQNLYDILVSRLRLSLALSKSDLRVFRLQGVYLFKEVKVLLNDTKCG